MKKYAIGADIGGTTVKLGFFTVDGKLLTKWEIPTDTSETGDILKDIAVSCELKMQEQGLNKADFVGIGLGVPGPVREDGSVDMCVNLGWQQKQVKEDMEEIIGIPAAVTNDANAAALGEAWQGGARGCDNVVMVTLGTGVGGGVIVGGKIIAGAHGYGGEIGHIMLNTHETVKCNCGKAGCLEQYSSATGIVNEAKKALAKEEVTTILNPETLTAKDVFDAAKSGDVFAIRQVEQFASRLARGLSFISGVTDPEVFVIGGGVSKAGSIITDTVQRYFRDYVFGRQKETSFALAVLGNDAGIYGCASLVVR